MGRYDSSVRCAQIRELIEEKQYLEAMEEIEELRFEEVPTITDLYLFANLFLKAEKMDIAKELYYTVYHRTSSRPALYRLLMLTIRMGDLEEAKEYAMYYANVNSGGINRKTILKQEEESRMEDHANRIAHYEAYQMYRKHYKEILDAISEENCFPDSCSGGGVYLRDAILKKVPEITEEQLRIIWRELPFVLEKRTQEWIEREKQFSENYIRKHR